MDDLVAVQTVTEGIFETLKLCWETDAGCASEKQMQVVFAKVLAVSS